MLDWFVPENTWKAVIVIVVIAIIITLIMLKKNIEFPQPRTKLKDQERLLKQCIQEFSNHPLICPLQRAKDRLSHLQPNEQHQEQETTRTKHGQYLECEDYQETKE